MNKSTKEIGDAGEDLAAEYLVGASYMVLKRNWRNRFGEIDIIAKKDDFLVFVEVKKKKSSRYGSAGEMITPKKLRRISALAHSYIAEEGYVGPWRIDAVLIDGPKLTLTENISF